MENPGKLPRLLEPSLAPRRWFVCDNPIWAPRCTAVQRQQTSAGDRRTRYESEQACRKACKGLPADVVRTHLPRLLAETAADLDPSGRETGRGYQNLAAYLEEQGLESQFQHHMALPLQQEVWREEKLLRQLEDKYICTPSIDVPRFVMDAYDRVARHGRLMDTARFCRIVKLGLDLLSGPRTMAFADLATVWTPIFSALERSGRGLPQPVSAADVAEVGFFKAAYESSLGPQRQGEVEQWLWEQPGVADPTMVPDQTTLPDCDRQKQRTESFAERLLSVSNTKADDVKLFLLGKWPLHVLESLGVKRVLEMLATLAPIDKVARVLEQMAAAGMLSCADGRLDWRDRLDILTAPKRPPQFSHWWIVWLAYLYPHPACAQGGEAELRNLLLQHLTSLHGGPDLLRNELKRLNLPGVEPSR